VNAAVGSWGLTIRTPVGRQDVVVDIAEDDAGVLSGTARSAAEAVPLQGVVLHGDRLTWSQAITRPMRLRLTFEVTVDGDAMSGFSRAGRLPRSAVTGVRDAGAAGPGVSALLLSAHVVLAVGPVTVAASLFRPAWQAAAGHGGADGVRLLHRITRTYAGIGVAVPVLGLATAASLGVLTDPWVLGATVLVIAAAAVLVARVLPLQRSMLEALQTPPSEGGELAGKGLAAATGAFNLLWVAVVVLMVWRPGNTTGV